MASLPDRLDGLFGFAKHIAQHVGAALHFRQQPVAPLIDPCQAPLDFARQFVAGRWLDVTTISRFLLRLGFALRKRLRLLGILDDSSDPGDCQTDCGQHQPPQVLRPVRHDPEESGSDPADCPLYRSASAPRRASGFALQSPFPAAAPPKALQHGDVLQLALIDGRLDSVQRFLNGLASLLIHRPGSVRPYTIISGWVRSTRSPPNPNPRAPRQTTRYRPGIQAPRNLSAQCVTGISAGVTPGRSTVPGNPRSKRWTDSKRDSTSCQFHRLHSASKNFAFSFWYCRE